MEAEGIYGVIELFSSAVGERSPGFGYAQVDFTDYFHAPTAAPAVVAISPSLTSLVRLIA